MDGRDRVVARAVRRWTAGAAMVGASIAFTVLAVSPAGASETLGALPGTVAVTGAAITGEQWVTTRTLQLTVDTNSFTTPQLVEVTFPVGYTADSTTRWPVTYYLGGFNHDQTTFRSYGGEAATASFPSLVVSPSGGVGYWNDWFNNGAGGPPKYETFVTAELIPLVDANFRTAGDRAHRAIMGESGGGYGVLLYAAKHPQLFAAAASLSGTPDITGPAGQVVFPVAPLLAGGQLNAIHGPWATQQVRWRGNNPNDLAENLRGVDLQLYEGSGIYDPQYGETAAEATAGCATEATIVRPTSTTMHQTLLALGIPHTWVDLPWGCHSVPLFHDEIQRAIPRFAELFAAPSAPPATFDHKAIAPNFTVWDWTFTADPRRALEFLDLHDVSATGLTVAGSGTTTITTAPLFGSAPAVDVNIGGVHTHVRPDADGRLTFVVDLGPADTQQQYTLGAVTRVTTVQAQFTAQAN